MLSVPVLLVLAFATYRATRVFTTDTLSDEPRAALYRWAWRDSQTRPEPEPRAAWRTYVYELATCPFCLGVWCAGVLYLLWRADSPVLRGLIVVLAIAGVQAVLQHFDGGTD